MPTRPAYTDTLIADADVAASRMENGAEYAYSDDELTALVEKEVQRSAQDWQTKVAAQREQAHKHYYGELFGNERPNFSKHVSREVFDSVEDIKADLMAAFTSGPRVLRFEEEQAGDAGNARAATEYVHALFYRQNRGYNVIKDCLHDALLSKQCCVRRSLRERIEVQTEEFMGAPKPQLVAAAADPEIERIEIDSEEVQEMPVPTPGGMATLPVPVCSGRIVRKRTVKAIVVEVLPPEDVFITVQAADADLADAVILRFERTKSELVAEGFDPDIVDTISEGDFTFDSQDIARKGFDDTHDFDRRSGERERAIVDVFEAYLEIDMDGDGIAEKWKVTTAGNTLLDKEQVAEFPLHFWGPYRISHKSIGLSVADVTMDLQRTQSGLIRGIVDNVFLTNTSTKIADLSIIRNPRDVIDNPIGVVIDSPDPDAVKFVPQPQINPATFNAVDLMKQQKEERTGKSRLSAGTQDKVISHQNSADLIQMMMQAGSGRITEMARSFAETFLKPLFCGLYRMGVEAGFVVHAPTPMGFEVLDPSTWLPMRHNMKVHVALTPDDRSKHAGILTAAYQQLSADPSMAPLFGMQQKYNMIRDILELSGASSPDYLLDPSTPQGQQALKQAAEMAQQQAQQQQAQSMAAIQMQLEQIQAQIAQGWRKLELQAEKQAGDALSDGEDQSLEERQFEWNKKMDEAELELERQQVRNVSIGGGGA